MHARIEIPILCHLCFFVAKILNSESGIYGHKKAQMTQNRNFGAGVHSLRVTTISWRDGVSDAVHQLCWHSRSQRSPGQVGTVDDFQRNPLEIQQSPFT